MITMNGGQRALRCDVLDVFSDEVNALAWDRQDPGHLLDHLIPEASISFFPPELLLDDPMILLRIFLYCRHHLSHEDHLIRKTPTILLLVTRISFHILMISRYDFCSSHDSTVPFCGAMMHGEYGGGRV
jgi:hypothetical protein